MRFLSLTFVFFLFFSFILTGQQQREVLGASDLERAAAEDVKSFFDKNPETKLADLSFEEILEIASALSLSRQKEVFIKDLKISSFVLGGLGHYKIDEPGLGVLFTSLDVVLIAGTLAGAYTLLPESLKQGGGGLDYFGNSASVIHEAWQTKSFLDLLPSLAVLLAGTGLRIFYLSFVADNAEEIGRAKISSGEIKFTAQPYLELGRMLTVGLGVSLVPKH